ncbi:MAG: response regulator [Pseudomonadota bacterium]
MGKRLMASEFEKDDSLEKLPRVLVVDDENVTRMSLWHILKKDFDVKMAESGNIAVEQIRQGMDFDVVSLDLKMPGMSGIETLKAIKTLNPTTEILLVTAHSDIESAKQAIKLGAYDYIDKPVDKNNYREAVRKGVQRRHKMLASEKTKEQLETVKAQLLQSDKLSAIGELLAGVMHEINNPLTSILGYSELLLSGKGSPEKKQKYLENIRQSALLCQNTVSMLLAFSRKQKPKRDYVRLPDIINSTLGLLHYEIKANNILAVREIAENMPPAFADYYQIQQVFLNIITNAIQAMKSQTRTRALTVKGEFDDKAIRISIIDTGPGIPKANIQKIFEPFFTTKPEGKGTGLGLSICLEIIRDHAGDIYISSEPGGGSCFIVEIPIVSSPDAS